MCTMFMESYAFKNQIDKALILIFEYLLTAVYRKKIFYVKFITLFEINPFYNIKFV